MADLKDITNPVVTAIYNSYKAAGEAEATRPYLGASQIGKDCERALWYSFRWVDTDKIKTGSDDHPGRMYRLFRTGHLEEDRFVSDLRSIGASVWDRDPTTGRQFRATDQHGHMAGHFDAVAKNIPGMGFKPYLCEFKTHNAKSFEELLKKGMRDSKPEHYAQMQWYMAKNSLDRGLYLAKNKDNDALYSERVDFNQEVFEKLQEKAARVIFSTEPPSRISDNAKFYKCNMCSFQDVCHYGKPPKYNCRTCVSATPEKDGDAKWSCAKTDAEIPVDVQRTGCDHHLPLPFLLTFATAIDAGEGWVKFKRKDSDVEFIVSSAAEERFIANAAENTPVYLSAEVCAAEDHKAIGDAGVDLFRDAFSAKVTG